MVGKEQERLRTVFYGVIDGDDQPAFESLPVRKESGEGAARRMIRGPSQIRVRGEVGSVHRQFRGLLDQAKGVSEFVVIANADIRGFSAFSREVESPDVAMYIKKAYARMIDDYFPSATYFKPTGDGLVIVLPYAENDLKQVAESVIATCLRLVRDFATLVKDDPMINFVTPDKLGIGVARGTACRLMSGDLTLDFSGRFLNLASRLMDLARPGGVVIDGGFADLLSTQILESFQGDEVYLRGIAAQLPIKILFTKEFTVVSEANRHPLDEPRWELWEYRTTLGEMSRVAGTFRADLPKKAADASKIAVQVVYPAVSKGRRLKGFVQYLSVPPKYVEDAHGTRVELQFPQLSTLLRTSGVKRDWKIRIEVRYQPKW